MGKFLKIRRYIDNLIAFMGACFSTEPKPITETSSLKQPLLVDSTKSSDLSPEQYINNLFFMITSKTSTVENTCNSQGGAGSRRTVCSTTQSNQNSKRSAGLRKTVCSTTPSNHSSQKSADSRKTVCVEQGNGRFKLNSSTSLRLQCIFFGCLPNIVAYVNLLSTGYVLTVVFDTSKSKVEHDYILPEYLLFLKGRIDENAFRDNLKRIHPTYFDFIFQILTYPRTYCSLYY
jgi:hypothetical protein